MNPIDMLPNEMLCKILGLLSTHEKFRAREVCQKWKGQVDEYVPFYAVTLSSTNDSAILSRFQTRRVASLVLPASYRRSNIPIQNLSYLYRVKVVGNINRLALTDLVTRAINLTELEIWLTLDSDWAEPEKTAALLPALRNIKNLYFRRSFGLVLFESWKTILRDDMPKLKRLEIDVSRWRATNRNIFDVATLKPNLREFTFYNSSGTATEGMNSYLRVKIEWEEHREGVTGSKKGLRKLNFIGVACRVLIEYEEQLGTLLSNQSNLEELRLYDSRTRFAGRSYAMSIIQPALRNSMGSLHTIRLDVETENHFDMRIFAPLATLRHLHLNKPGGTYIELSGKLMRDLVPIRNCSTVISGTLHSLLLYGFRFSTQEANNVIKEIAKLNLERVEFARSRVSEISVVWNYFQRLVLHMGLKEEVQVTTNFLPTRCYGIEFYFTHNANT